MNWKTTSSGIAAILAGAALILKGNITEGIASIIAGIGLMSARDHNK